MEYGTCTNRDQFASELAEKLIENPSSIYCNRSIIPRRVKEKSPEKGARKV